MLLLRLVFFRLGNADCIFSILKVKVMSTMLRLLLIELQKCLDMCTMFFETNKKKIKSFTVYIIVRYFVLMGIHSLCTNFKALLRISDFHRNILYIFNTVRLRLRFVDHSSIWKETFIQRKIGLARFSAIYFLK